MYLRKVEIQFSFQSGLESIPLLTQKYKLAEF